jgi:predicted PolB exonuclease-like 3'-5' exonuclease
MQKLFLFTQQKHREKKGSDIIAKKKGENL